MNPDQSVRSSNKTLGWIIGIIIIVIAAGLAYWFTQSEKTTEVAPNQTVTTAADGKTVSNFPDELMLEQDAAIKQSFSLADKSTGVNQPVVQYVSKRSLSENVVAYRNYLANNGWAISHEANPAENPTYFYASNKDGAQLNITFVESAGQVSVSIAYANKV